MAQETQAQIAQRVREYDNAQLLREFIRFKMAEKVNFWMTNHQHFELQQIEMRLAYKLRESGFFSPVDSLSRI